MNAQVRYRFRPRPTKPPDLQAIFTRWLETALTPKGCKIDVRVWDHPSWPPQRIRAELRKADQVRVGCPGVVSHYASPTMVLCDYDRPSAPSWFTIANLARSLDLKPINVEYHRTRRGWHLAIEWDRKLKPAEAVALQLLLGSDRGRETFNLRRVLSGRVDRRYNLLFEFKL